MSDDFDPPKITSKKLEASDDFDDPSLTSSTKKLQKYKKPLDESNDFDQSFDQSLKISSGFKSSAKAPKK